MFFDVNSSQTLSIVIPAYNEELRLPPSIRRMVAFLDAGQYAFEIVVVNDGSRDNTAKIVSEMSSRDDRIKLISQPFNQGKGAAVRKGITEASGQTICFSDADLSTPIEELPKFLTAVQTHDLAIGIRSPNRNGQSIFRKTGGFAINRFVQMVALPGILDSQCGFKVFRSKVAKELSTTMTVDGFSFDIELLYNARQAGYSIKQIPVAWQDVADSKVSPIKDGLKLLHNTIRLRIHSNHRHGNRRKFTK